MTRSTVAELARLLDGEAIGDLELDITRMGTLATAGADAVAFLANPRYRQQLDASAAGCVIVAPAMRDDVAARRAEREDGGGDGAHARCECERLLGPFEFGDRLFERPHRGVAVPAVELAVANRGRPTMRVVQ